MAFQAVIGAQSLKSFTKSLTCLSRYGDDVAIQAGPEALILSAVNSSRSAFFRVTFDSNYFDKYKLKPPPTQPGLTFQTPPDIAEIQNVTGQLLVKSLLSILKHKTLEKTVDRCELSIVERGQDLEPDKVGDEEDDEEEDSLSSKLVVRLHCKHGVVKTHRLLLLTQTDLLAPAITSSPQESCVVAGPRAIKDILDHFPHARGSKNDPRLVWQFAMNDATVKSIAEGKGKSQIATEITISADEFDSYTIREPPVSISFHLREFNATVALADSLSVALYLRFTEPGAPVHIEFDTDFLDSHYLFVISTTPDVFGSSSTPSLRKRGFEDDGESEYGSSRATKKKPLGADTNTTSASTSQATPRRAASSRQHVDSTPHTRTPQSRSSATPADKEPLFMPGASQLSAADMDVLRDSGLGIEHMDYDEFEAMMDAEGEEVGMSTAVRREGGADPDDAEESDTNGEMEVEMQMGPSQAPVERRGGKEFRPLFDD